jgi:hypothetical protein
MFEFCQIETILAKCFPRFGKNKVGFFATLASRLIGHVIVFDLAQWAVGVIAGPVSGSAK